MGNNKKIVITGASGFLGSHLVERLKDDRRYEVYALTSHPDELREKIGGECVNYLYKDAVINNQAPKVLKDAVVVNCAYPRNSTGTAMADGLKYIQRVFESTVSCGACAIINISSQSVYSQHRTEVATEKTQVCLESPYAVGKYAVELMLESICKRSGMSYASLRMASLIGPGFDQRIVNRFIKQAYSGEMLRVSIGNQCFGFLDIEDAVSAIIALIGTEDKLWKPIYTVGNAEAYSLKEIVGSVKHVFEEHGLKFPDVNIVYEEKSDYTAVDYKQIRIDTGFMPRYSLEATIRRILANIMSQIESI